MTMFIKILAAVAAGTVLATSAFAQSAREIRGADPYGAIENEPVPKLIVDPAVPDYAAQGRVHIQYRVENVRIVPVFGAAAANVSPRVGYLHITVDDLPWWWADMGDLNTIDLAGLPAGQHKVLNHAFPGCATCSQRSRSQLSRTKSQMHRVICAQNEPRSLLHCRCEPNFWT